MILRTVALTPVSAHPGALGLASRTCQIQPLLPPLPLPGSQPPWLLSWTTVDESPWLPPLPAYFFFFFSSEQPVGPFVNASDSVVTRLQSWKAPPRAQLNWNVFTTTYTVFTGMRAPSSHSLHLATLAWLCRARPLCWEGSFPRHLQRPLPSSPQLSAPVTSFPTTTSSLSGH